MSQRRGVFHHILDRIPQMIDAADDARPVLRARPCDLSAKRERAQDKLSELLEAIKRRERLGFHFAYLPCHALPDADRWERDVRKVLKLVREEAGKLLKVALDQPPFPVEGDERAKQLYLQATEQFLRRAQCLRGKRLDRLQELAQELTRLTDSSSAPVMNVENVTVRAGAKTTARGKNISGRMLAKLQQDPDCAAWSAQIWAGFLSCVKSTVIEAPAWQTIRNARALQQADGVSRRRGNRRSVGD